MCIRDSYCRRNPHISLCELWYKLKIHKEYTRNITSLYRCLLYTSYLKSMAWSVESDKGFSLCHMKKKYFVENLYKKNSISVQYNPDLMYLNSERLTRCV